MAKDKSGSLRLDGTGSRPRLPQATAPGIIDPRAAAERRANRVKRAVSVALWYAITVFVLGLVLRFEPYVTTVGEPARTDVVAPFSFEIIDATATEEARRRLYEQKAQIWIRDTDAEGLARQQLNQFFDLVEESELDSAEDLRKFSDALFEQFDIALQATSAAEFSASRLRRFRDPLSLSDVRRDLELVITDAYNNRCIVTDKPLFRAHAGAGVLRLYNTRNLPEEIPNPETVLWYPDELQNFLLTKALPRYFPDADMATLRAAAAELLREIIEPNIEYSRVKTDEKYAEDVRMLLEFPRRRRFAENESIVTRGEPLNALQATALGYLNDQRRLRSTIKLIGIVIITAVIFFAVGLYLRRFRRGLALDATTVALHVLPPLLAISIAHAMLLLGLPEQQLTYWFPAGLIGMLASLLFSPQVAFVLVLVGALLTGLASEGQGLQFIVLALFGGFAAALASRTVRARGEVLRVGLYIGIVNVITITLLAFVNSQSHPDPRNLLAGFLNGLVCALITLVFLVIIEWAFGIVTDLKLLELTGLKHPLIRQLEEKAPGSYQHVLNVVKLAEAAADAIGANYLLVRAGAYFHDIGKMLKPNYFSENQVTIDDKKAHSRLTPYMSVLIIKNHVKEGMELGRKFGLPQQIIDFIPQHHGTDLIRYFYSEALRRYEESETMDPVREEDFRYPGPKPQSIETAIVMLADTVEATAASKFTGGQVSEDELRRAVQTSITTKFNDGQFDECPLTLAHLSQIREAFVRSLMARYHFRVAYPALPRRDQPPPPSGREARSEATSPSIAVIGPAASAT